MCDHNKNIDNKIKLLEYHHKSMESRRSIGFKAFISLVAFYLILTKGYLSATEQIYISDIVKWSLTFLYIFTSISFFLFMVQIEAKSRSNRNVYIEIENDIFNYLFEKERNNSAQHRENIWLSIRRSWAATWPIGIIFILSFFCIIIVWSISSNPV